MANFSNQTPGSDVLAAYQKATQLSPMSETDKNRVLKDYGIAKGWAKGKTQAQISGKAASVVTYEFNKKNKINTSKPKPAPAPAPTKPATGSLPVSASMVSNMFKLYHLPAGITPPPSAMASHATLKRWALRTRSNLLYGA